MLINAMNGGVTLIIQGTDTKLHVDYMINTFNLVYFAQGFYVPKPIKDYCFGYSLIKDTQGNDVNIYNYLFDRLPIANKYFSFKENKLVDYSSKMQGYLADGMYYTQFNDVGILQSIQSVDGLTDPVINLNQALHAELLNNLECSLDEVDFSKSEVNTIVEANKKLVDEINAIKQAINNIALTIKTIPAVVGSPLNPALITDLIINPADTFENQANIFEDLVATPNNEKGAKIY